MQWPKRLSLAHTILVYDRGNAIFEASTANLRDIRDEVISILLMQSDLCWEIVISLSFSSSSQMCLIWNFDRNLYHFHVQIFIYILVTRRLGRVLCHHLRLLSDLKVTQAAHKNFGCIAYRHHWKIEVVYTWMWSKYSRALLHEVIWIMMNAKGLVSMQLPFNE